MSFFENAFNAYTNTPSSHSKSPTQTTKWKTLQKLTLSYFLNVLHLMGQISDNDMLRLAFSETAKLVPYVTGSRKTVKVYLKTCLDYWATAEDSVRISAFLSVRRLAAATDESILDNVLKVCAFLSRVTKKSLKHHCRAHT